MCIGIKLCVCLWSFWYVICFVWFVIGFDLEDGVDVGVVGVGCEGLIEVGGGDVVLFVLFFVGVVEGDVVLVDDEVGGEVVFVEGVVEGGGVVGFVGWGVVGCVWGWVVGGVGVVVGDVVGVVVDVGVVVGFLEDGGYFGGGLKGVSLIFLGFVRGGYCLLGLRLFV